MLVLFCPHAKLLYLITLSTLFYCIHKSVYYCCYHFLNLFFFLLHIYFSEQFRHYPKTKIKKYSYKKLIYKLQALSFNMWCLSKKNIWCFFLNKHNHRQILLCIEMNHANVNEYLFLGVFGRVEKNNT